MDICKEKAIIHTKTEFRHGERVIREKRKIEEDKEDIDIIGQLEVVSLHYCSPLLL